MDYLQSSSMRSIETHTTMAQRVPRDYKSRIILSGEVTNLAGRWHFLWYDMLSAGSRRGGGCGRVAGDRW